MVPPSIGQADRQVSLSNTSAGMEFVIEPRLEVFMNSHRGGIRVGTSGWSYKHWQGQLYCEDVPSAAYLSIYTQHCDIVEVNSTFYHLPDDATVKRWRDTASDGFLFAVKASRYITHMKKLKDPAEPVGLLLDRVEVLGEKLGPNLFQCPPNWRRNTSRLESFFHALPSGHQYVFEFKDRSWFHTEIYDLLSAHGAALCIYDLGGEISPQLVTADIVYVRLHKPRDENAWDYDRKTLTAWAQDFKAWEVA